MSEGRGADELRQLGKVSSRRIHEGEPSEMSRVWTAGNGGRWRNDNIQS